MRRSLLVLAPTLSKKSQTALQLISRRKTKHAAIASGIAEVPGKFIAL
jgi:hypothetical protein